jgi:hypothetical protein
MKLEYHVNIKEKHLFAATLKLKAITKIPHDPCLHPNDNTTAKI